MDVLASVLLPRRISQIYADTKKSYEHIVRNHVTNPQVASLHLKLRIQKDRLQAWGLEWADTTAAQSGDIDGSLDRAGISDLVASIMSSIQELLDEADRLQPLSPSIFPTEKTSPVVKLSAAWTDANLARLADIVKDITVSIDTLCDLSRSQQAQRLSGSHNDEFSKDPARKAKALDAYGFTRASSPSTPKQPSTPNSESFPLLHDTSNLISSTRIDPQTLIFLETNNSPGSRPPPYDAVATAPSNRAFALLRARPTSQSTVANNQDQGKLVMIDFGNENDSDLQGGKLPSLKRYESLVLALQGAKADTTHNYTGCFKIIGWFADRRRARFGFVYDIPQPRISEQSPGSQQRRPQTLISYLQHSGDSDSANMPCLEDRFRLALNLASNLLHTHAKGLTHRSINSNNIVFVEDGLPGSEQKPWKDGVLRMPFLVSWDQSVEDVDANQSEMLISSIYRHPKIRQGQRSDFKPAFDVYSLGLILLEIGLWMPIHKLWKAKYSHIDFQRRLETIYTSKLSAKCSTSYMRAVLYCLTLADTLDSESSPSRHQGSESQHAKQQTDFYWKVLKRIEKCCLLDESQEPILVPASSLAPERVNADPTVFEDTAKASSPINDQVPPTTEGPRPEQQLKVDSPFNAGLKSDLLVWSHKVPNTTRAYFETVMMPKLGKMFARAIDRWESYEIDIFMAGETADAARPTLLMVCRSIMKAWKILEYVNNDQKLFDVRVASGQIHYSKNTKKRRKPRNIITKPTDAAKSSHSTRYCQKPTCGASIGAFVDEQHLEAVTFGGIVLVDGDPYGMSVHHMLEDQDIDRGLDYVLDEASHDATDLVQGDDTSQFLDDDELDADFFDQDFDDDEERFNLGDTLGTSPGRGRDLVVTQPALDDVDPSFFPNEEDMSDDHLSSHGLGYIHASSGLKQVQHGGVSHEVDWALFKVAEGRLAPHNVLAGGQKFCGGSITSAQPCAVMRADSLGDLDVHAIGSKSGLAAGKIWSYMTMTKMPGRVFASPVWRFQGGFGVGGDSGAWLVANDSGAVCGHVTAWSEYHQNGTISPMEVMLHDMEQTLGKPVALPLPQDSLSPRSFREQLSTAQPHIIIPDDFDAKGKARDEPPALDSNYGSDSESDDVYASTDLERADTSCTSASPPVATSPSSPDREMSHLSLDEVAEQWRKSQVGKQVGKDLGRSVHTELHGLEARC